MFGIKIRRKFFILLVVCHSITEVKAKQLKQTGFVYVAQSEHRRAQSTLIIRRVSPLYVCHWIQGIKSVHSRRCWCLERDNMEILPRHRTKHQIWSSCIVLWCIKLQTLHFYHALAGVADVFLFDLTYYYCVFSKLFRPLLTVNIYIVVCWLEMRVSAIIFTRLRSDTIM